MVIHWVCCSYSFLFVLPRELTTFNTLLVQEYLLFLELFFAGGMQRWSNSRTPSSLMISEALEKKDEKENPDAKEFVQAL